MQSFEISDLVDGDLEKLGWSGSQTHIDYVAAALERARDGEVVIVVVDAGAGPIAIGAADLTRVEGAAKFWMLTVHPDHRSMGFGAALMDDLEARVADLGFTAGVLSVKKHNERARSFYERLGWEVSGQTVESWTEEAADGSTYPYSVECWVMTKALTG